MTSISEYINSFDLALRCKYSSKATIKNYSCCVKKFLEYSSGKKLSIPDLIKNYLVWSVKSKEPKTINLHRSAIVCFFKLVKGIDISVREVPRRIEFKKLPKIIPIDKIAEAIRKTLNVKHRLELMLFFDCGIRLGEIANLRKKNIVGSNLWLSTTKGNKGRIVPVSESVLQVLSEYIVDMGVEDLVFGGVCNKTFQKVVKQAFERIGIKANPHMLRHSFATHQIISGENPFKVQSWLGHSSIKTTQLYVSLSSSILSKKKDLINGNYTNQRVV